MRVKRLAAEVGDAPDIIRAEHGKQAVGDLVGERLAVGKVPRLFVEAVLAVVRAAGDEQAHAHAGTVCDVAGFDIGIIHKKPPSRAARFCLDKRQCSVTMSALERLS